MDFIITVCDSAAGEACPIWPGQPISAHWGFEDPAAAQGSDEEKRRVFEKVFRQISSRIHVFISLPLAALDKAAIHRELKDIGASDLTRFFQPPLFLSFPLFFRSEERRGGKECIS